MSARFRCCIALVLSLPGMVAALEFRSIAEPGAVLFDAPAGKASKLFILSAGYPVEVIVNTGGWSKVRDQTGQLAWIEDKHFSSRHYVMVKKHGAEARRAPEDTAPVVFSAELDVYLELIEASAGWAKVRHADGATGFVKITQLWGL
ncbi:MAG: SH3 domain-containing protein [Burkholderiales bacterium]